MKKHYLIEYDEEIGYITACNLEYEDSDNVNFVKEWKDVTCKKCLKKLKGGRSLPEVQNR